MFTVSIIEYSVNKLESQWGWLSHVMLRYLQLDLVIRFKFFISKAQCATWRLKRSALNPRRLLLFFLLQAGSDSKRFLVSTSSLSLYNSWERDGCSNKDPRPRLFSPLFMQASLQASFGRCWPTLSSQHKSLKTAHWAVWLYDHLFYLILLW